MKVAILSDVHDQLAHLDRALAVARDAGCEALLCCGDLCSPFVVPRLGSFDAGPVHVVFGNNDGDRFRMALQARAFGHLTLHGEFAETELDGKRFALTHYPEIGRPVARSGLFDVVCYGHNHELETTRDGETWKINPGEVFGGLTGRATFVVYDTGADHPEVKDLGEAG